MIRRILVLVGDTPSSVSARVLAFRLAQQTDAAMAGLAGIDVPSIAAPMPGRAGGTAYLARLEQDLKDEAAALYENLRATYGRECEDHRQTFEWLAFEGDPVQALTDAAETHDLIVTGHDTAFHAQAREPLAEMLARWLPAAPRPVLICADETSSTGEIIVAYDASVAAMRALQMFALSGLGQDRSVHVTAIDADAEKAARHASAASKFLRAHGLNVEASPIASHVDPEDALRIEIADRKAGMLVMGAYGRHRGVHDFLFGSTTGGLIADPPCALFVYH